MEPILILIVEDDDAVANLVQLWLQKLWPNAQYSRTKTLAETLNFTHSFQPDIVILDLCIPGGKENTTLDIVLCNCANTPIIVLSGYISQAEGLDAIQRGAMDYVLKGDDPRTLINRIQDTILKTWARVLYHRQRMQHQDSMRSNLQRVS